MAVSSSGYSVSNFAGSASSVVNKRYPGWNTFGRTVILTAEGSQRLCSPAQRSGSHVETPPLPVAQSDRGAPCSMARTRPHPGAHPRGRLAHASGVGACSWASAVGTLRDWFCGIEIADTYRHKVEMVPTRCGSPDLRHTCHMFPILLSCVVSPRSRSQMTQCTGVAPMCEDTRATPRRQARRIL